MLPAPPSSANNFPVFPLTACLTNKSHVPVTDGHVAFVKITIYVNTVRVVATHKHTDHTQNKSTVYTHVLKQSD